MTQLETQLLEKLRTLPADKQHEVLDFVEFLITKAATRPHINGKPQLEEVAIAQAVQHDIAATEELEDPSTPSASDAAWDIWQSLGNDAVAGKLDNTSTQHDRYLYSGDQ